MMLPSSISPNELDSHPPSIQLPKPGWTPSSEYFEVRLNDSFEVWQGWMKHPQSSQRNHVISSPMVTTMVTTMVTMVTTMVTLGAVSLWEGIILMILMIIFFGPVFDRQVLLRPGHEADAGVDFSSHRQFSAVFPHDGCLTRDGTPGASAAHGRSGPEGLAATSARCRVVVGVFLTALLVDD